MKYALHFGKTNAKIRVGKYKNFMHMKIWHKKGSAQWVTSWKRYNWDNLFLWILFKCS